MQDLQNIEFSQCTKEVHNIGSTTYKNICTGEQDILRWGTLDTALWGVTVLVLAVPGLIMLTMVTVTVVKWVKSKLHRRG